MKPYRWAQREEGAQGRRAFTKREKETGDLLPRGKR